MSKNNPNIFEYINYRSYLKDFCDHQKENNVSFSHRYFLKIAGIPITDVSVLGKVIKGNKNLSQNYRLKFAKALKLKIREIRYFEYLVQFNQTKSIEQKNYFFSVLSTFRGSKAAVVLTSQVRLYSKWYYSIVRSYLGMENKNSNPNIIAKSIYPKITPTQVKEAIKVLLECKLIKKMANGYKLTDNHITTENEVVDMTARRYIQDLIQLSIPAINEIPAKKRHYYSNVFSISQKGLEAFKERLINFEIEQREFIGKDKNEDRVYTFNIQLFPNTDS